MSKQNYESRSDEAAMLQDIDGIDPAGIAGQIANITGAPAPEPPAGGVPPEPPKSGEAPKPAEATDMLKEIFGDRFSSVDEVKQKNIPGILDEYDQLRQQNQTLIAEKEELSGKLSAKPRTGFVNDDVALFNEFVKETGVSSFDVFNKLNKTDIANMDPMDAIILTRILQTPELAQKELQLRKSVEKSFNVDPDQVSEEELDVNRIELTREGSKAKAALQELKGKLKIPEQDADPQQRELKWTPEQETQAKNVWTAANNAMGEKLSKIPIFMPEHKEPLVNFSIPEEMRKKVEAKAIDFAISNRMEANEQNLTTVAKFMYSEMIMGNLDKIAHSIFEKARSLNQEESLKYYHNPSPLGGDRAPAGRGDVDEASVRQQEIFDAEMNQI